MAKTRFAQDEHICALGFIQQKVPYAESMGDRVRYKLEQQVHTPTSAACCHPPTLLSLALVASAAAVCGDWVERNDDR